MKITVKVSLTVTFDLSNNKIFQKLNSETALNENIISEYPKQTLNKQEVQNDIYTPPFLDLN